MHLLDGLLEIVRVIVTTPMCVSPAFDALALQSFFGAPRGPCRGFAPVFERVAEANPT